MNHSCQSQGLHEYFMATDARYRALDARESYHSHSRGLHYHGPTHASNVHRSNGAILRVIQGHYNEYYSNISPRRSGVTNQGSSTYIEEIPIFYTPPHSATGSSLHTDPSILVPNTRSSIPSSHFHPESLRALEGAPASPSRESTTAHDPFRTPTTSRSALPLYDHSGREAQYTLAPTSHPLQSAPVIPLHQSTAFNRNYDPPCPLDRVRRTDRFDPNDGFMSASLYGGDTPRSSRALHAGVGPYLGDVEAFESQEALEPRFGGREVEIIEQGGRVLKGRFLLGGDRF
ncbi:hypothetical protein CAC42_4214 [Sphaceloma murrayae]|uniref:Uncharacterized protein n=1 Tax=Sphaceloma murrayae TaxID=2082308 RepID=A0A2K1QLC7_9PEZI|nr:hypothetical protein CAC42_4214 [Sphaceloma murrayae]